ncbi:hypothetical protein D1F64_06390 [Breoghania sp. L-A4]|nr:hypothetical protein [Breoghania sp. L-A4]AXS39747.1 hypothetical protein D1F64_06390 [Breoghania sp. L-A4]
MDISDGLGQSLLELAGASNVGISINGDSIPLSTGVVEASEILGCSWPEIVMGPGLDLKLLGTMADCDASRNACDQLGISIIGRTTTDRNLKWISRDNVSMKIEGYDQLKDDLLISLKN